MVIGEVEESVEISIYYTVDMDKEEQWPKY